MTNLILPTHVAKARAKQVKKEAKKKEEAKLPEPTGWRLLILPHSGKGKTKGGIYIAFAHHMGHAKMVAFNDYIVFLIELQVVRRVEFFGAASEKG